MDNAPRAITPRNTAIGIGLQFIQIGLFVVIAVLVKILSPEFPVFAILFCRYAFCLPLLLAYGLYERGVRVFTINDIPTLLRRTAAGLLGLTSIFIAFGLAPLSLVSALNQTMPIFVTLLAIPMLGERVGVRRIAAVSAGFLGVLVLLNPPVLLAAVLEGAPLTGGIGAWGAGIGFALAGALFSAMMYVYLRRLGRSDAPVSTALWYNTAGLFYASILGMFDGSVTALIGGAFDGGIDARTWVLLVGIGVLASFQQFVMATSHSFAEASTLAPVHYFNIPLAAVIGIVFFGEVITPWFIIGAVIIIAANYYILMRERRLRAAAGKG